MPDADLTRLRELISKLDAELVQLLNQRAELAVSIGALKADAGTQVYDPKRERTVIDQIDSLNKGPLTKGMMEDIFVAIITACREIQIK